MKVFVRLATGDIVSKTVEPEAIVIETLKQHCVDQADPHPERLAFFIGSRRVKKDDQFRNFSGSVFPIFEVMHLWRGLSISEDDDAPDPKPEAVQGDCKN
ncbi:hypothetical protein FGIG_00715 [Fasciola gigantica]|uniref:Ubiquitin-like domain-containing protein n=1 Tax=Fasciola gigantica TaxID=46835 RepID=A0A504YCV1_FASGI|nr:hypothetical protein FGIG_00715 [Fasciola gigantica]